MDNNEKLELKANKGKLIDELEKSGAEFKGNSCRCPFCDDKNPSAGIYEKDGLWAFKCHKCGYNGDIISIMAINQGLKEAEILAGMSKKTEPKKAVSYRSLKEAAEKIKNFKTGYRYKDPKTGRDYMYVFRIEKEDGKKTFLQGSPDGTGGVILKSPPKPHPIYKAEDVLNSEHVICVEGEKCVSAVNELGIKGICATTSPGGAGKSHFADWSILAGKNIYLWPDNDEVGINHMKDLSGILEKLKPHPAILWIDPDDVGLGKKEDVYDFLERYKTEEEKKKKLQDVLGNAEGTDASTEVISRFKDIISGKRETIPLPWPKLSKYTKAIKPGTVTLICGEGGAAKSYLLLQLCQYWIFDLKHEVAIYELEDDRPYHVTRALAQKTGVTGFMDDDWVKENGKEANAICEENKKFMAELGRSIHESPLDPVSLTDLARWVDDQAKAGKRIICIDPITAASNEKDSWIKDHDFITSAKKSVMKYGASLVLVTHPKKGGGKDAMMDNLSGGAVYSRLLHTVLWIKNLGNKEEHEIIEDGWVETKKAERILWILKARNSYGGGKKFAMTLENLKLKEVGEIKKKKGR